MSRINGLAPFYLQELISLKEACKYKLRSDCDGLLLDPVKFKTLTTLGDRSFAAAAAPKLWNIRKLFCDFMRFLISFLVSFMQFFTI